MMHTLLYNKTAKFHTLGCKLNFAETSTIQDILKRNGIEKANDNETADICIINTCSVTEVADHKCRQAIHKLKRENPNAIIIVIGCYAQLCPNDIAQINGVDLVLGMEQKGQVPEQLIKLFEKRKAQGDNIEACHEAISVPTSEIKTFVPSCSKGDRTRYFLKVQDGCNYYCTYCTIPMARGRSRNGSIESIVNQAKDVAAKGGKEIVITGVNIGDFGKTTNEKFFDLVKALDNIEGIERYRISSIEPNLLTDEIIDYCATSRAFMPHFHIPLQSGSDDVLKLMHRKYDTKLFANKIEKIKTVMPDAFIGIDVIVGTRGETDAFFEDAYSFIKGLDISQLHVFSYSERPGTKALEIPHIVSPQEKHARSQRLLQLSEEKKQKFYKQFIGSRRTVLWEHSKDGIPSHGFTDNYIRVENNGCITCDDNTLSVVNLCSFNADCSALTCETLQGNHE